MYTNAYERGTPAPHEAEIRAYQLILAMGQHGKYFYSATGFFASLKVRMLHRLRSCSVACTANCHEYETGTRATLPLLQSQRRYHLSRSMTFMHACCCCC